MTDMSVRNDPAAVSNETAIHGSAAASPAGSVNMRKIVAASVVGNVLEWFDFFIYGNAAALVFGSLFFPSGSDPLIGTVAAFGTFAIGFAARPVGGIFFGHMGDRYGRKRAMLATLGMMGVATCLIGLLPTYQQVGALAPVLLVVLRIVQGIASGGEWGAGVLLISENAAPARRGYYAAWSQLGVAGGFVLSALVFLALQALPTTDFLAWGWRLPFLGSIAILGVGFYIRRNLPESEEFKKAKPTQTMPLLATLRQHPRAVLQAMGIRIAENGGAYVFLSFPLIYAAHSGIPSSRIFLALMIAMTIELITIVAWGALSDRIGRKAVYMIGAVGLIVFAFPFFWLMDQGSLPAVILALTIALPLCHSAMIGVQPALMGELFPPEVRYTGMALGHEVASIVSGGLSPMVATALLAKTHASWPVSLMLVGFGAVTVMTLMTFRSSQGAAE